MVQIRSLENHMPMPGIEVGDLGTKLGYNTVDNGYLSFNQVRIPRTDMLSRFIEVDKEGSFSIKGDPRMLYQTMVQTRLLIFQGSMYYLLISCRHATRYAACRRQFRTIKNQSTERKLLDYQTHMSILGPPLCLGMVIGFVSNTAYKLNKKA